MIDNLLYLKLWVFVLVLLGLVAVLAVSGHAQEPTLPAVPLYFHNSKGEACVQYENGCVRCVEMAKPAEEKPVLKPRKHFWVDRLFWYSVAINGMAVAADMHSTAAVIDNCPYCQENGFLTKHFIGTRPAHHKLILWGVGMTTIEGFAAYEMKSAEKPDYPGMYLGFPLVYTTMHGLAAKGNYDIYYHLTARQRGLVK